MSISVAENFLGVTFKKVWDNFGISVGCFLFPDSIPFVFSGPGDPSIQIPLRNEDVSLTLFPFGLII